MSTLTEPQSISAAQQAMDTLTAQWYNAVVHGCGLDSTLFQLVQGNVPIGTTSESLWNMLDAIPPLSVTNYYNPSQLNNLSTNYGAIINNLKPQNATTFLQIMGDYYSQWQTYLNTNPPMPAGGILQLFYNWSQMHMPPGQAQSAYTAWQEVAQGAVPVAVQMWLNAGGGVGGTKAYNYTYGSLQTALTSAPGKTVTLNSLTDSSDVTHTWAQGQVEGAYDFFSGGASGQYDHLSVALAQAGITINATFTRLVTFTAGPLAKPSTDPILSQYQPWYDDDALSLAYNHSDNTVWNNTGTTWNDAFGPNGNMQRAATSLVIVDGITINMSSEASFSSSDQTAVKAAAQVGFFPFFKASASGGWQHNVSFDDSGKITINSTCPAGNPNVLGVLVTPIQGFIGGQ